MILDKHLSIREAKNELWKLENELGLYLNHKKINFIKTQASSVTYKDIIISKTHNVFDNFLHYVIKDDELDDKIYSLQESIIQYQKYIVEEMRRMSKYDEVGLICYLREEEHRSWKYIDKILNRSYDYSKVKYSRYKKMN